METKRLLKLADFLETVPRERFDMSTWATGDLRKCGTAGCALGWATMIPSFRRAGLTLGPRFAPRFKSEPDPIYGPMKFFDISNEEYCRLFFDSNYQEYGCQPTPKQVAKRIRRMVKDADAGGPKGSPKGVAP